MESKTNLMIYIPEGLVTIGREHSIPFSKICSKAIDAYLNSPEFEKHKETYRKFGKIPKERIKRVRKFLKSADKLGTLDRATEIWAEKLGKEFDVELTKEDILTFFDLDSED